MQQLFFGDAPRLTVQRERCRSLREGHPWLYDGALKHPPKNLPAGMVVDLIDEKGGFLGRGSFNDQSQIVVRMLTFRDEPVDEAFIRRRVAESVARREGLLDSRTDCCRLVFAEADRLPGLIVDRHGDWLVIQVLTAGMEVWRDAVVAELRELRPRGIYERSDGEDRRRHEGLEPRAGLLWGEPPPEALEVSEHGHRFAVDIRAGHKTGFYLDQRDNRAGVATYARGRSVLNAFSYTGGFGVYAAAAGASEVVHVDSSGPALALCRANLERNGLADRQELLEDNVFEALRSFREQGRTFDLVVLDPPKFAASRKQLDRATRGYKDLNIGAFRLLAPGGLLATFSCSGAVDPELFLKVVAAAAADAGRQVQVVELLGQPVDHPVLLAFPEGRYLNGLVCRVLD